MKDAKYEYDMEFWISFDRKFNETMNHSKEFREFVQVYYSDMTEGEQMDIYRTLLLKSMKE